MFKNLFSLTKPGIIFGNLITLGAGFFLVTHGSIDWVKLIGVMLGVSLIIASGCVFNNCIDVDIDRLMERTQNRVLVKGLISIKFALIYAVVLAIAGIEVLYYTTNLLTVYTGIFGLFIYVVIYSLWLKRTSSLGTLIGSLSGATPPVMGYVALTNHFDLASVIFFLILAIWQMPHSYAIAIYRLQDYTKANIPVLPVKYGVPTAKIHMLFYIILFAIVASLLTLKGYTGYIYLVVLWILSIYWIYLAVIGFRLSTNNKIWARKMFMFSVILITILSILIALD